MSSLAYKAGKERKESMYMTFVLKSWYTVWTEWKCETKTEKQECLHQGQVKNQNTLWQAVLIIKTIIQVDCESSLLPPVSCWAATSSSSKGGSEAIYLFSHSGVRTCWVSMSKLWSCSSPHKNKLQSFIRRSRDVFKTQKISGSVLSLLCWIPMTVFENQHTLIREFRAPPVRFSAVHYHSTRHLTVHHYQRDREGM